jgi:hypothetical protein
MEKYKLSEKIKDLEQHNQAQSHHHSKQFEAIVSQLELLDDNED